MHYEGTVIRPPSEADSIILQVTVGCSHNRCTFCGAYKDTRFRIKETSFLDQDIAFSARYRTRSKRVFLADGDALILPQKHLVTILEKVRRGLPWIQRISSYANARAIRSKSPAQLRELRALGLDRIYMGLESGDDGVLDRIRKGETAHSMVEAALKVRDYGIYLSVTVLLGIGGIDLSAQHAVETGKILTLMAPRQIAALTLIPMPNTPLFQQLQCGAFRLPDNQGMLRELRLLVDAIKLDRSQFHANHASNYLPLSGRLQRDKQQLLETIDSALAGHATLMPEYMRTL